MSGEHPGSDEAEAVTHTGSKESMPFFMWKSAVVEVAHVSEADAHNYCGRARIERMFDAGEPVWMAANAVKAFVVGGKRHERNDREVEYLAGKMRL